MLREVVLAAAIVLATPGTAQGNDIATAYSRLETIVRVRGTALPCKAGD
jgi:hypothetical protein